MKNSEFVIAVYPQSTSAYPSIEAMENDWPFEGTFVEAAEDQFTEFKYIECDINDLSTFSLDAMFYIFDQNGRAVVEDLDEEVCEKLEYLYGLLGEYNDVYDSDIESFSEERFQLYYAIVEAHKSGNKAIRKKENPHYNEDKVGRYYLENEQVIFSVCIDSYNQFKTAGIPYPLKRSLENHIERNKWQSITAEENMAFKVTSKVNSIDLKIIQLKKELLKLEQEREEALMEQEKAEQKKESQIEMIRRQSEELKALIYG